MIKIFRFKNNSETSLAKTKKLIQKVDDKNGDEFEIELIIKGYWIIFLSIKLSFKLKHSTVIPHAILLGVINRLLWS